LKIFAESAQLSKHRSLICEKFDVYEQVAEKKIKMLLPNCLGHACTITWTITQIKTEIH